MIFERSIINSCLLISISILGCVLFSSRNDGTVERNKLIQRRIIVGRNEVIAPLPRHAKIETRENGVSIDFARRLNIRMTLTNIVPANNNYDRSYRLKNGFDLKYRIDKNYSAGSGGEEAVLEGKIINEDVVIYVSCSDQSAMRSPNPKWCIKYWHNFSFNKVRS